MTDLTTFAPISDRFAGRVAIVTGGGAAWPVDDITTVGTGVAIATLLARQGAKVAVLDKDPEAIERTLELIAGDGEALAVEADIGSEESCAAAVAATAEAFGGVDFLVNNVGLIAPEPVSVTEVPDELWDRSMLVNVKGMALMSRHALRHMPAGGAIVNISSIAATRPHAAHGVYPVTKGAVNSLTVAMAVEHGPRNIRVNAVLPGGVWTPLAESVHRRGSDAPVAEIRARHARERTLLGTDGTGWDIAHAVAFLCSDQSRWITAQALVVDGGATAPR